MDNAISQAVRALAEGDFMHVADRFANAGFSVRLPSRGILQLTSASPTLRRPRLLLSAGIHGDETAPIEMLSQLLEALACEPQALVVDLMVVIGNLAAIAQGKRLIDADLNRLFRADRGALASATEASRADMIMCAAANFFAGPDTEKWHLDLHTTIRPSHYPTFAVVPAAITEARCHVMLGWLGRAGIGAAILNPRSAGTFSAYTATSLGATSSTVELGQIEALGHNELRRFEITRRALDAFIRSGQVPSCGETPQVFHVAQELIKNSEAFRMVLDRSTQNFTPMQPDSVIAVDGDTVYRVGDVTEYVVFPNPDVALGLRAGLMVIRSG